MSTRQAEYRLLYRHLRRVIGKFDMWDATQKELRIKTFNTLGEYYDWELADAVFRSWENAHRTPQIGPDYGAKRALHYRQLMIN